MAVLRKDPNTWTDFGKAVVVVKLVGYMATMNNSQTLRSYIIALVRSV